MGVVYRWGRGFRGASAGRLRQRDPGDANMQQNVVHIEGGLSSFRPLLLLARQMSSGIGKFSQAGYWAFREAKAGQPARGKRLSECVCVKNGRRSK